MKKKQFVFYILTIILCPAFGQNVGIGTSSPLYKLDVRNGTGSAHSQLIPFWSGKLGKTKMQAKQLSTKGDHLWVEQKGDRVQMGGTCVFYMKGEISVDS